MLTNGQGATRREFLTLCAAAGGALGAGLLASCTPAPAAAPPAAPAAAPAAAATTAPAAAGQGQPLKIGYSIPLSGSGAFDGTTAANGAKLAAKVLNDAGGVLGGRRVEPIIYDDAGNPEQGVAVFKKMLADDKVVALTGAYNSSVGLAQKEISREAKILHIVGTPAHPDVTEQGHPYLFRLNVQLPDMEAANMKYIEETLKAQKVYFLLENTDAGRLVSTLYKNRWSKPGSPQVAGEDFFALTDTDFSAYLAKVKSINPDVLYASASGSAQGAQVYKQAKQLGLSAKQVAGGGQITAKLVELLGNDFAEGLTSSESYLPSFTFPANKEFVQRYQAEYKELPTKYSSHGYECIWIAATAMNQAGSTSDYDKIARLIRETTWETPRGQVKFDAKGQALVASVPVTVKQGVITPVG